jgi:hypothetical protein
MRQFVHRYRHNVESRARRSQRLRRERSDDTGALDLGTQHTATARPRSAQAPALAATSGSGKDRAADARHAARIRSS